MSKHRQSERTEYLSEEEKEIFDRLCESAFHDAVSYRPPAGEALNNLVEMGLVAHAVTVDGKRYVVTAYGWRARPHIEIYH